MPTLVNNDLRTTVTGRDNTGPLKKAARTINETAMAWERLKKAEFSYKMAQSRYNRRADLGTLTKKDAVALQRALDNRNLAEAASVAASPTVVGYRQQSRPRTVRGLVSARQRDARAAEREQAAADRRASQQFWAAQNRAQRGRRAQFASYKAHVGAADDAVHGQRTAMARRFADRARRGGALDRHMGGAFVQAFERDRDRRTRETERAAAKAARDRSREQIRANRAAAKSYGEMGRRAEGTFRRMTGAFTGFITVFAAGHTAAAILRTTAMFERLDVVMNTLLGSPAKGSMAQSQILHLARNTPATLEEVTKGYARLIQSGAPLTEVQHRMEQITDIASGSIYPIGEAMDRLTKLYQRAEGGFIELQDVELVETIGLPFTRALKEVFGVTRHGLKDLVKDIGAKETFDQIMDYWGKQYEGNADKMMAKLGGAWARLKQSAQLAAQDIGDEMSGSIVSVSAKIEKILTMNEDTLKSFGRVLAGVIDGFGKLFDLIIENNDVFKDLLAAAGILGGAWLGKKAIGATKHVAGKAIPAGAKGLGASMALDLGTMLGAGAAGGATSKALGIVGKLPGKAKLVGLAAAAILGMYSVSIKDDLQKAFNDESISTAQTFLYTIEAIVNKMKDLGDWVVDWINKLPYWMRGGAQEKGDFPNYGPPGTGARRGGRGWSRGRRPVSVPSGGTSFTSRWHGTEFPNYGPPGASGASTTAPMTRGDAMRMVTAVERQSFLFDDIKALIRRDKYIAALRGRQMSDRDSQTHLTYKQKVQEQKNVPMSVFGGEHTFWKQGTGWVDFSSGGTKDYQRPMDSADRFLRDYENYQSSPFSLQADPKDEETKQIIRDYVGGAFSTFNQELLDGEHGPKEAAKNLLDNILKEFSSDLMDQALAPIKAFANGFINGLVGAMQEEQNKAMEDIGKSWGEGLKGFLSGMFSGGSGGGGGFFASLFGGGMEGGGYTGNGPRTGGLDGKGGFLTMLHPRESVIDHVKGTPRMMSGRGGSVVPNISLKIVNMPSELELVEKSRSLTMDDMEMIMEVTKRNVVGDLAEGGEVADVFESKYGASPDNFTQVGG